MENTLDHSYFAVITHDVLFHPELAAGAKLLYACLTSLAKKEGYAWPTDEYLAKAFNYSKDQIKDWLKELEDNGFIQRETYNEGFNRKRRIWIARDKFKKVIQRGEFPPIDKGKEAPSDTCESPPFSIYTKNIKEKDNNDIPNGISSSERSATPPPRLPDTPAKRAVRDIGFDFSSGSFTDISSRDLENWTSLFPAVDIGRELRIMAEWCIDNPKKAKSRRKWRDFIRKWLTKENDRQIEIQARIDTYAKYSRHPKPSESKAEPAEEFKPRNRFLTREELGLPPK